MSLSPLAGSPATPPPLPTPPPRLSWPEVTVVGFVLGFIVYMIQWVHVPIEQAAITGVCTGAALVVLVLMPKAFLQLLHVLRELNARLSPGRAA